MITVDVALACSVASHGLLEDLSGKGTFAYKSFDQGIEVLSNDQIVAVESSMIRKQGCRFKSWTYPSSCGQLKGEE